MSSSQNLAYGVGVATQTESGQTIDCHFHSIGLGSKPANKQGEALSLQQDSDLIRKVKKIPIDIGIELSVAPKDVADVYLRLHLLGVRIADGDRVRLGAYLSAGTTVMHEGFVNFNAGTLGKSMVEGRISSGVVVGDGSDIGGGASIMGTLSGGGKEVISIGERTLLGANSGAGISLGDDCVIEAGVYITAGSKILLPDGKIVKAKELSGANNLLFRRNSQSGALEVVPKSGSWSGLNSVLHNN